MDEEERNTLMDIENDGMKPDQALTSFLKQRENGERRKRGRGRERTANLKISA
jgi:hypothetical protein